VITLRERLQGRSEEALREVGRHWGVPAGEPPDPVVLAARMAAENPVRTAFDRLASEEKEVLRAMDSAAHRGWIAVAHLHRQTRLPDPQVADLIASLERKAIAFMEERDLPQRNPYWGPTWAGRKLPTTPTPILALPQETQQLFLDVLAEYSGGAWYAEAPSPLSRLEMLPLDLLRAMAAHYGVSLDGVEHSASRIAARLQGPLKEPQLLWKAVQSLPPPLRALLDAVEAAGGRLPMESVREQFAPEYEGVHALVRTLSERGLAFDRFIRRTRMLLMPDRVLDAVAQHTLPTFPRAKLKAAQPAGEARWHHELHWSLLQLVRHIRLEGLSRTATTHAVPKRTVARLIAQMHPPPVGRSPEEWIEQLILYLVHAGVLPDAAHLRLVSPEPEWLRQDPFTQARALFTRWLDGHVEDLRQTHHDLGLWMDRSLLASGRVLLTDLLRRCKPGEWYSIDSLLRAAAGLRPHFLRERDRILRQQGYRGLKQMLTSWFTVEGTALLMHLTGIPFEIGMVALDAPLPPGSPAAREGAFQLTDWGAALLGLSPRPAQESEGGALIIQPNFEVVVMEFIPALLDDLGQFASPVGYDRVATYRIEHRGVNLAIANGWTTDRILEVLQRHARVPIPQNVEQSLRDWGGSVQRACFARALVIEADDPEVLEDLAAAKPLQRHVRKVARGAILLIQPDANLRQIARELRAEGFLLEEREE
jgi:hypothetical protein